MAADNVAIVRSAARFVSRSVAIEPSLSRTRLWIDQVLFSGLVIATYVSAHPLHGLGPVPNIAWFLADLLAVLGVFAERRTAMPLVRRSWPVVAILVLALCSAAWSDEAGTTVRRALGLVGTCAGALYFACRLGVKGTVKALAIALTLAALVSLVLVIFFPDIGLMQDVYVGSWRGIFFHKNKFGEAMIVALVSTYCAASEAPRSRRPFFVGAALIQVICLFGSQNATGVACGAALLLILPVLLRSRKAQSVGRMLFVAIGAIVLIIASSAFGLADLAFAALGRDATFTGRTDVWQFALESIWQKPLGGYGYRAFWDGIGLNFAHDAKAWEPGSAHDGYLELTLSLGLIGLAFLVIGLFVGFRRAAKQFWSKSDITSLWPLAVFLYVTIINFSDSSLVYYHNADWLFACMAFFLASQNISSTSTSVPSALVPKRALVTARSRR